MNPPSLDYMVARYYEANLGRFLSADPKGIRRLQQGGKEEITEFQERISNPQVWNAYTYVLDNPLRSVDPNGEDLEDAIEVVVGVVKGAANSITLGAVPALNPSESDSSASLEGQVVGAAMVGVESGQATVTGALATGASILASPEGGEIVTPGAASATVIAAAVTVTSAVTVGKAEGILQRRQDGDEGGHRGGRPSTKDKHERGDSRRGRDKPGGEKGDKSRREKPKRPQDR